MMRISSGWIAALGVFSFFFLLDAGRATSAQDVDLHDLTWYVHVDLIDAGAGRDLGYWQNVLDEAVGTANVLLEGGQGPFDTPCCTRLGSSVSLSTFGTPGDGLDVIDSAPKQSVLSNFAGGSSKAFLVDSMTWCGASSPGAIGCASTPSCSGNGNDDPNLWMAVTVEAFDDAILPAVIAHERGHNTCLNHVAAAGCQIMQASVAIPGNGGCLTASECTNYRNGRTETVSGLECGCHASAGVLESNGTMCTEVANGVCSGGLCGDSAGDAGVKLIAAAHPGDAGTPSPDDALEISAVSGDWTDLGQISPTSEDVFGMAYARDSGTLYGVVPSTGDDQIVTIDPDTGDILATVGSIANGGAECISMAYHPGATSSPADDRLIMMEVSGVSGTVVWVDPASPSVRNVYGTIIWTDAGEFKGLAYDSVQGRLVASTPYGIEGLYEIDLTSCPPSPCDSDVIPGARASAFDAGLTFSPETGKLYQVATRFGGARTFFATIDAATGIPENTISLDLFTPGALAAVPEPGFGTGILTGISALVFGTRERRRRGNTLSA